ncbi:MAG: HlyC/CorC family transporter [Clostridia bacterium]|nr:HlyC/CorC family transporter [Clostridia bacterium]
MQLLVIFILVLINGFFAASEIAYISLNDAKIEKLAKDGNKKAKKIKDMLVNPSKFLATIQIGITLAGFLSSAFAAESFASVLAPKLYLWLPQISLNAWNNISIVIITIVLSYFTLVFGELVPKRIAMKHYEKIAFGTIGIIRLISIVASPFVKFLTFSTDLISEILGVSSTDEEIVTEEEIRLMVDVGEEKGSIDEEEKDMINNVFEFNDKVVSEIMIPRTKIFALDKGLTIEETIKELSVENNKYSRIPVYNENIDHIVGVVYVKDILLSMDDKNQKLEKLMKEAYLVPENKLINEVFNELRKSRKQIAIVVDEYGGTSGIVTIEDILEEIVGEIYDEYDEKEEVTKKIDNNTYLFSGNISLYNVEDIIELELEEGNYDTLSGYLVSKIDKVPTKNDIGREIETEKVKFIIEQVKDKQISLVKVFIKDKQDN